MRSLDEKRQNSARLAARRKSDRFRRGDPGVALADDFGPAADDRALNEAEALERHPANFADELAGRTRTAAAPRFVRAGLLLRHFRTVMP